MTIEAIIVVDLAITVGFYNANSHCRLREFPSTVGIVSGHRLTGCYYVDTLGETKLRLLFRFFYP